MIYVSCGNKDDLINISQRVHRYMKDQDIPRVWDVDDHTHDRDTWASKLYYFAPRIFR